MSRYLFGAVQLGDCALVKRMMDGDACARDRHERSLLSWATEKRHIQVMELLLAEGADVDHASVTGMTPLMFAVKNDDGAAVALLLRSGANPNATDSIYNQTAIFQCRSLEVMRLLLASGAHVNVFGLHANGLRNSTPLAIQSFRGDVDTVACLLQHGADPTALDGCGRSALAHAFLQGHASVIDAMLANGVRPDGSALKECVLRGGMSSRFHMMLREGVDVNHRSGDGTTTLDAAVAKADADYIMPLIGKGALSSRPGMNVVMRLLHDKCTDYDNLLQAFPDMLARSHAPN